MRRFAVTLLACAALLAGAQARNAPPGEAPVRVRIWLFTSSGAPPELDGLRTILPNLLRAALFPYRWIETEVVLNPSPPDSRTGDTPPDYTIQGQFVQLGERTRVDVTVRQGAAGGIIATETASFTLAEMLDSLKTVASGCARAIRPSALQVESKSGAGRPGAVALAPAFTDLTRNGAFAYLREEFPKAIERSLTDANLKVQRGGASATGDRFSISGTIEVRANRLRGVAQVSDREGTTLPVVVEAEQERAYTLPETLAELVTEVLHGALEQTVTADAALHPAPANGPACLKAAELAREQHRLNLAAFLYRRALLAGLDPDARVRLIELYAERGARNAALSELRQMMEPGEDHTARGHFARGWDLQIKGESKEALAEYEKGLGLAAGSPFRPYFFRALGEALSSLARPAEAAAQYEKAIQAGLRFPEIYRALAVAYTASGQASQAIAVLEKAQTQLPGNSSLRNELATLYRDLGVRQDSAARPQDALASFRRVADLKPGDKRVLSDACTRAAYILRHRLTPVQNEEALRFLNAAIDADPRNEWAYRVLALLYNDTGRYKEALTAAQRALDIEVSHRGYWVLSQIYLARNEPAQAVAVLQKAVALGGSQVSDSLTRLAQAHRAAGDIDLALQALSDAKALSPTNEWTWRVEGVLLRQLARYEESAAAFSKAQSLRSTSMAFQGLGDTLLRLKRFPEAEQALRKAVQLSAACSACSASLAKALASQNREPEALAALEAALGKEPGPFADYYSLADVYKRLGKPEQGAAFLREALRKYPDSYTARAALNTLLHDSMFDFEGAYQGNRQLFDKNPNSDAVKANLAEAAFTAGRNDEALQLAGQVLSAERGDPQRRLAMRIITVAASLARNETGQAFSELGKFVDDYREVPRDWDRTWRFDGLKRCLQTSAALNALAKEILTRMVEALETNRPASDEAVKRIESLLTSDTFLKLRR